MRFVTCRAQTSTEPPKQPWKFIAWSSVQFLRAFLGSEVPPPPPHLPTGPEGVAVGVRRSATKRPGEFRSRSRFLQRVRSWKKSKGVLWFVWNFAGCEGSCQSFADIKGRYLLFQSFGSEPPTRWSLLHAPQENIHKIYASDVGQRMLDN